MSTDTANSVLIGAIKITADGTALTSDQLDSLVFAEAEQTFFLPAMATLRFYNTKLLSNMATTFAVGKAVEIQMGQTTSAIASVFSGEVVALDLDFAPTGTPTITVRAYDKSHRLMRDRKTRTFIDVKDSDVVSTLAGEAGLSPGADTTSSTFKWLIQNNETNYDFLLRRALRIGYEVFVDGGTTLKFRKPTPSVAGGTVTWAKDLYDFKVRVSATKQIDKASVRGWDRKTKKEIVGQATTATAFQTPGVSADGGATAKKAFAAASFDGLYRYVQDQTEAQNLAQAVLDDVNARYIQCEGRCRGNTAIKIGTNLDVKGIGTDYSGKYYMTSVTHRFDTGGYTTYFESNGKNTNTIIEMTNQVNQNGGGPMSPLVGLVTAVKDSGGDNMGRIKVKFPTLGAQVESDWISIATPMTGGGYGLHFMPEVNDEVLIAFANGDIGDAYMVGGIWNGTDKPPLDNTSNEVIGGDGKVYQRVIKTRSGHIVTFNDSDDKPGFSIVDKTGNNKFTIDSTANNITIESDANITLKATKGTVTIDAKDIEFKASQNIKSTATQNIQMTATQNITGKATQNVQLEGTINFEAKGTAAAKMEGASVEIKGSAAAKIDGGAMTEVKGGIIKLN